MKFIDAMSQKNTNYNNQRPGNMDVVDEMVKAIRESNERNKLGTGGANE